MAERSSGDGTVRAHGHQYLRVRARGGEYWYTYLPLVALSTLSPLALWTQNWWL